MTEPALPSPEDRSKTTGHLRPRRGPTGAQLKPIYEAGASVRAIAEEYRMGYGAVYRRLKLAGTRFRPQGGVRRRSPAPGPTPEQTTASPGSLVPPTSEDGHADSCR